VESAIFSNRMCFEVSGHKHNCSIYLETRILCNKFESMGHLGQVTAIVLAAGQGTRYQAATPKQFSSFDDETMLTRAMAPFLELEDLTSLIVVVSENHQEFIERLPNTLREDSRVIFTPGGETRGESIKQGIRRYMELEGQSAESMIVIHDSCRPHLSNSHLNQIVSASDSVDAWVTFSRTGDSYAVESKAGYSPLESTGNIIAMHTPIRITPKICQKILESPSSEMNSGLATFLLNNGVKAKFVQSDGSTRKLTFPEDGYVL
jgi:2-C-methyl-D-erythritol 4-phosphate cytidylyltransferase